MNSLQTIIMVCQRCLNEEDVYYRAHSDIMDIMVCPTCAEAARQLEITVEHLDIGPVLSVQPVTDLSPSGPACGGTPPRRRRPIKSVDSN